MHDFLPLELLHEHVLDLFLLRLGVLVLFIEDYFPSLLVLSLFCFTDYHAMMNLIHAVQVASRGVSIPCERRQIIRFVDWLGGHVELVAQCGA